ncbi:beta-ketoacyl-ACP synthase III [Nocardia jiangsuensis]|uniref:Beta-ketoacyl-[acyl-carrier-protein] synthase III n=1 Tax=Nocardia jiangsuensis TaxID=1691563 RepID=A0ABV8DPA3_9NOCA
MSVEIAVQAPPAVPHSAILGLGVYRPSRVVTNDELAESLDSSDEWIRTRSGIRSRRLCTESETLVEMSLGSARQAIESSGIDPQQIDCVLLATMSSPLVTPATAPLLATELGLPGVAALDVVNACAGFCSTVGMASDMIRAGTAEYVLVIGAERLSDMVDWTDRTNAFLFGDGAGAAVIGPSETVGIGPVVWGSDGSHWDMLGQNKSMGAFMDEVKELGSAAQRPIFKMDGPALFRWTLGALEQVCQEALKRAGVTVDDLDAFIPHQANGRITEMLARQLKLPAGCTVAYDIVEQGNTSAASVPLAMEGLLRTGAAKPGDIALLIGFGAGLVYAAQVVRLPGVPR